jgi:hypothetical protein
VQQRPNLQGSGGGGVKGEDGVEDVAGNGGEAARVHGHEEGLQVRGPSLVLAVLFQVVHLWKREEQGDRRRERQGRVEYRHVVSRGEVVVC